MKKMTRNIFSWILVGMLVFVLSGCSQVWDETLKPRISDEELLPAVERIVDEQLDQVLPFLDVQTRDSLKSSDDEELTGKKVVEETLGESNGHAYLQFCYDVAYTQDGDIEEFVENAKQLLPEEEASELDEKVEETKAVLESNFEDVGRGVPPSQRAAFNKDVRRLVVRTLVLFVAGMVYSAIPTTMFWGKVSAASAIAVAAGVVSCTIMNLYQYYKYGGDMDESFGVWMKEVSTEPEIAYAMASSIITMGKTLHRSSVVTGISICVFSLYNVLDMVKDLLKKYTFTS
jgi:uncharacterized membrane protein YdbT with pleckstrin-like domain